MTRFLLALLVFFHASARGESPARPGDLPVFTDKDMYVLAQKIGKSLVKCRLLRKRPNVVVEVENKTGEIVDKTRFSQLIHSQIEWKTHNAPEEKLPDFDVRAVLEANVVNEGASGARLVYTLTARAFQAEENLCEKKASITKRISPKARPGDAAR